MVFLYSIAKCESAAQDNDFEALLAADTRLCLSGDLERRGDLDMDFFRSFRPPDLEVKGLQLHESILQFVTSPT